MARAKDQRGAEGDEPDDPKPSLHAEGDLPSMLDHLSLGVTDLERAMRFYDAAFAPLGYGPAARQ